MKTILSSIKTSLVAGVASAIVLLSVVALPAAAATSVQCAQGQTNNNGVCTCPSGQQPVSVTIGSGASGCVPINNRTTQLTQNPIFVYLRGFLIFLGGGVGIAVVGGIVFGAYMYITARGNAGQTQKGQMVILNAVIGLLLFMFMYAILQFLIPGGIFQ